MKNISLLVLLAFFLSFLYFSLKDLPFLQLASYSAFDSATFHADPGRTQLRGGDGNLTESGRGSAKTGPYEPPLIIGNTELCKDSPHLDWIVYVHSSGEDSQRRLRLRKTWANTQLFKDFSFKIVFFLGAVSDDVKPKVVEEYGKYRDIVQGDFVDSHRNLTLKAVLAFRWISTYCPHVPYAVKADSDVFVNILEIAQVMRENRHKPSFIMCNIFEHNSMPILRDPKTCGKYCALETDLPGETFYPQYCSGPFWIISRKLVREFYEASKSTPFIFCEDAYMTGLLAQKNPDTIDYMRMYDRLLFNDQLALDNYNNLTEPLLYDAIHVERPITFVSLWNALLDRLTDSQKALLQQPISNYKVPSGELFVTTE